MLSDKICYVLNWNFWDYQEFLGLFNSGERMKNKIKFFIFRQGLHVSI